MNFFRFKKIIYNQAKLIDRKYYLNKSADQKSQYIMKKIKYNLKILTLSII